MTTTATAVTVTTMTITRLITLTVADAPATQGPDANRPRIRPDTVTIHVENGGVAAVSAHGRRVLRDGSPGKGSHGVSWLGFFGDLDGLPEWIADLVATHAGGAA